MIADGAGGAIVVWHDYRCGSSLYAQRVDPSGRTLWAADGVALASSSECQMAPRCTSDGAAGLIAVWEDFRGGVYAQRVDAQGLLRWGAAGTNVGGGFYSNPTLDADGHGGAIIAFTLYSPPSIVAQSIDANGTAQWPGGVSVCSTGIGADQASVVSDGTGGAVIAWTDGRAGNYSHIWAQRIGSDGTARWTPNGIPLCTPNGNQTNPQAVTDGAGGAIVVWVDYRNGTDADLYARRVTTTGDTLWNIYGNPICTARGNQVGPSIAADGAGGAVIAWQDGRGTDQDPYVQRLTAAGAARWIANGVPLSAALGDQTSPQVAVDRQGSALAAWNDARVSIASIHVYAQRVDSTGSSPGNLAVTPGSARLFRVLPAQPNPTRAGTTITFELEAGAEVSVDIFDLSGRRVRSLAANRPFDSGLHSFGWDARNAGGTPVTSGIYFARVRAGGEEGRCAIIIEH